ncbi:helix-turn-helix domain-containing protein [Dactylosporangium sp. NPDC051484]|uniref:TetR/AcrR family transcriptional regulator n=1 Tax=Dactylosporangium sp. NPDC051484 TaxID=3154942 RepID=UPI00344FA532
MPPVHQRSDASRNAALLLAAARELIAEVGNDVALDEVARRAGVGNATLYRHFPTRGDLLVAVYADEVAALCERGERLRGDPDPIGALFAWLAEFVEHVATKRPLALAATEGPAGRRTRLFEEWHATVNATAAELVRRAAPALRSGVTAVDLLSLAAGAAITAGGTAHARHLVALLRDGVTAAAGRAV